MQTVVSGKYHSASASVYPVLLTVNTPYLGCDHQDCFIFRGSHPKPSFTHCHWEGATPKPYLHLPHSPYRAPPRHCLRFLMLQTSTFCLEIGKGSSPGFRMTIPQGAPPNDAPKTQEGLGKTCKTQTDMTYTYTYIIYIYILHFIYINVKLMKSILKATLNEVVIYMHLLTCLFALVRPSCSPCQHISQGGKRIST